MNRNRILATATLVLALAFPSFAKQAPHSSSSTKPAGSQSSSVAPASGSTNTTPAPAEHKEGKKKHKKGKKHNKAAEGTTTPKQ